MSYARRVTLVIVSMICSLVLLIMWFHVTASDTALGATVTQTTASSQTGVSYYQNDFGAVVARRAVPDKQTAKPQQTSLPQNAGDRGEVIMALLAPFMLVGIMTYILSPRNKEWNIHTIW